VKPGKKIFNQKGKQKMGTNLFILEFHRSDYTNKFMYVLRDAKTMEYPQYLCFDTPEEAEQKAVDLDPAGFYRSGDWDENQKLKRGTIIGEGQLGYLDGWLVCGSEDYGLDKIKANGYIYNIHPVMTADDGMKRSEILGCEPNTLIAGIRWADEDE
jgi:hypothetical protein